jgi:hypothetical protein
VAEAQSSSSVGSRGGAGAGGGDGAGRCAFASRTGASPFNFPKASLKGFRVAIE